MPEDVLIQSSFTKIRHRGSELRASKHPNASLTEVFPLFLIRVLTCAEHYLFMEISPLPEERYLYTPSASRVSLIGQRQRWVRTYACTEAARLGVLTAETGPVTRPVTLCAPQLSVIQLSSLRTTFVSTAHAKDGRAYEGAPRAVLAASCPPRTSGRLTSADTSPSARTFSGTCARITCRSAQHMCVYMLLVSACLRKKQKNTRRGFGRRKHIRVRERSRVVL